MSKERETGMAGTITAQLILSIPNSKRSSMILILLSWLLMEVSSSGVDEILRIGAMDVNLTSHFT